MLISAGIDPKGELSTWISTVAYAIIAALVPRMLVMPTDVLAETTFVERAIGAAVALTAYFWLDRTQALRRRARGRRCALACPDD